MPIAVVIILLVIGTLLFHFLSPWTFTPLASNWSQIDDTMNVTFVVTGIVFVAVNLFLAYAVIKYRAREGSRAKYDPENKKLETILTVVTAVGVVAMLTPGLFVWSEFVDVPDDAIEIEAVGQQWHWSYRLPGEDGLFGNVDGSKITNDNPFGMDADDPLGQDDILVFSPKVHLPVNVPVKVNLRSKDVLHDFAVAQFRVKMDLVPGMESYLWFTPTVIGSYEVLCEELCGIAHHTMRGAVVVDEPADYEAWLATQPTYADTLGLGAGNAQVGAAQYAVCTACHGPQGAGLQALNAPKIAGQEAWYLRRQLNNFKSGLRGVHDGDIFGKQMAPFAATLANDAAIENVIAHIQTFPDDPSPPTVDGDVVNGERLYTVCAYCHGKDAQGIQAINAPRMAGMADWYLATQLKNFRSGARGTHAEDFYGKQMGFMGRTVHDDASVADLVTYINTL
jgi:cytochrome c oxidase subunit II